MKKSEKRILAISSRYGLVAVVGIDDKTGEVITDDGKKISVCDLREFVSNEGEHFMINKSNKR